IKPGSRVGAVLTCLRSVLLRRTHHERTMAPDAPGPGHRCRPVISACRPPVSWATREESGGELTTDGARESGRMEAVDGIRGGGASGGALRRKRRRPAVTTATYR